MKSVFVRSICFGLALVLSNVVSAVTITFDSAGATAGSPVALSSTYTESGYLFTASSSVVASVFHGDDSPVFSASPFLGIFEPGTVTLTKVGGGAFNLISFLGGSADGASAMLSITGLGGVYTGSSNTTLSPGLTNVTSVAFVATSGTIGLDNIIVEAAASVPEPATAGILGLGGLVGAFVRYRRRRKMVPQEDSTGCRGVCD